jgi:tetratricopeptide (TPR) repeat protein
MTTPRHAWPWFAIGAILIAGAMPLHCALSDQGDATTGAGSHHDDSARVFWEDYRKAGESRMAGRLAEAVDFYDRALARKPAHEDALYYRSSCAAALGRYGEAQAGFERLIAANPDGSSRGYMQLGLLHASMAYDGPHDLTRAEGYFQQALDVDPDSGALLALGEVALLQGRWEEAARRLRDASTGDPMSLAAPYLLGFLEWRAGHRDGAWGAFRTAVGRGETKKPAVKWTEEGDVKADPALRWQALARQSVTGPYWIRVRQYMAAPGPRTSDMDAEYERFRAAIGATAGGERSRARARS